MTPDKSEGFECCVDADFAGGFKPTEAHDPTSCLSRTGCVIVCAGCPIVWSSKLQRTIALSTTEAECVALSTAPRDVIHLINLTDEFNKCGTPVTANHLPKIVCKTHEDNSGALELTNNHKVRPRTKHLAIQLHHLCSHTDDRRITVHKISTKHQIADTLTKPLPRETFQCLRSLVIGW